MENVLIFASEKEVRFTKLLKFIVPTYLTSLFNTVYTIIDGIFVSTYVGTNALASINIVYPIVNVLTGIALVFATGGSSVTALYIGGNRKKEGEERGKEGKGGKRKSSRWLTAESRCERKEEKKQ